MLLSSSALDFCALRFHFNMFCTTSHICIAGRALPGVRIIPLIFTCLPLPFELYNGDIMFGYVRVGQGYINSDIKRHIEDYSILCDMLINGIVFMCFTRGPWLAT